MSYSPAAAILDTVARHAGQRGATRIQSSLRSSRLAPCFPVSLRMMDTEEDGTTAECQQDYCSAPCNNTAASTFEPNIFHLPSLSMGPRYGVMCITVESSFKYIMLPHKGP